MRRVLAGAIARASLALLPLAASAVSPLGAVTLEVTTLQDVDVADALCSLREAIRAANDDVAYHGCVAGGPADVIDLTAWPTGSVVELAAALPAISGAVRIEGPGALDLAIDGMDLWPILEIDGGSGAAAVVVQDLTLTRGFGPGPFGHAGGAIVRPGDSALFRRVRFLANRAENGGGALQLSSGPDDGTANAVVRGCLFDGNESLGPVGGGAIYVSDGSELAVETSSFVRNRAASTNGTGGALAIQDSTVSIDRSTFSGNEASSQGGALFVLSTVTATGTMSLRIDDTTITENRADANFDGSGDGGGIALRVAGAATIELRMQNSLVAGNFDSAPDAHPDVTVFSPAGVMLLSQGANLVGMNDGAETLFVAGDPNGDGDTVGTAAAPIDPGLAPLADNGGGLPTHLPLPGPTSRVVDQGDCRFEAADQRGYVSASGGARAVDDPSTPNAANGDGCDVGAIETGAVPPASVIFADGFESGDVGGGWTSSP